MIIFSLLWPIFAVLYIWQGATSQMVSTGTNGGYFEVVNGVRYGNVLLTHGARSLMECAIMCAKEKSCSNFNFGFRQCELVTAGYYDRSVAPGWTHGYYTTGNDDPFDCADILQKKQEAESGIETIYPPGGSYSVFCDMETDGGGWTVIQRRQDGSVNFNRTYEEYARGFGELTGEFWLGNRLLHSLTSTRNYSLKVDLVDFDGNTAFALYDQFIVNAEDDGFRLTVGGYSGTAGDSLANPELGTRWYHNGQRFSAKDKDQDSGNRHCAELRHGGWWFANCYATHLNGEYHAEGEFPDTKYGITWFTWNYYTFLKSTEMKIRQN